ncbi:transmembrane domain-containing protein [Cryptosporidium canis]|uniref:Transmembrane domain-containing protein n=1 Tax=Cryptosporidium canis TaxID=195482 RepID=A0ABQ8P2S9_9CRYT|nr:transmembrane domain-containing protein [Cryptosporidium canis]KAJ1614269.1 transmembrane domain-containing protein [Cryptosporidium canis]
MATRKQEEVLVIYIKSLIQLVCSLCLIITVVSKDWIYGENTISESSVFGCLNELCIRGSIWPLSGQKWHEPDMGGGISTVKMENDQSPIDTGNFTLGENKLGKSLDHGGLYSSMLRHRKFLNQHALSLDLDNSNVSFQQLFQNNNGDDPEIKKSGLKHKGSKKSGFYLSSFDQVQYCISHKSNKLIKEWHIHPKYVNYLVLFIVLISMILSLRLIKMKNKWSLYELLVPILDFIAFSISLVNLAEILYILTPLLTYLQGLNFMAYFSTNFFIFSASVGGFFVVFVLSVGIAHYRYESFTNIKRLEEEIENLQSFTSFIHLISNSN